MDKEILTFLGLTEESDDKAVKEKISALKKDFGLDESATIADVIALIEKDVEIEKSSEEKKEFRDPRVDKILEDAKKINAENLVDTAIEDGKIFPADRPIWLAQAIYDFDGTKKVLGSKEKKSALPGTLKVNKDGENKTVDPVAEAAEFFKIQGRSPIAARK